LGQETSWGGIATATVTVGTAFMAQLLSRLMLRRGRRPGLQSGYLMAACGGVVAALGAQHGQLVTFIVGLFFFGSGQASNLLARYAATDLADAEHRSRSMSRIVFASTFGAVFGPLLIGPAQTAGQEWFGWEKYTGPWALSAIILAAAFVSTTIFLRPDPLVVIGGLRTSDSEKLPSISVALRTITATFPGRIALAAMVISQVVMVAVMTMTPVHMKVHGHESLSQYVVSLHIAGMFAFSPLVGRFADKHGRQLTILIGAIILAASTILSAVSGDYEWILFPALWALGVGGSSLLIESVPDDKRVTVQGAADLMMSFCGGMAGLASGFVRRAVGYHMLSTMGTLLAGALLAAAYMLYRSNDQMKRPKDVKYAV
jgi:MFS family permease